MRLTQALWRHQPSIRFLGKRSPPKRKSHISTEISETEILTQLSEIDHTPHVHPASPASSLPESFASYRQKAQQHGPIGQKGSGASVPPPAPASAQTYGAIGGKSGRQLGSVQPKDGEYWDRSELPKRFRRTPWSDAEMEAIESGGASMF